MRTYYQNVQWHITMKMLTYNDENFKHTKEKNIKTNNVKQQVTSARPIMKWQKKLTLVQNFFVTGWMDKNHHLCTLEKFKGIPCYVQSEHL